MATGRLFASIEALKKLDAEIQALILRRNTYALISCLPPEILCIVFAFMYASADTGRERMKVSFRITHVCHYWRVTALGYPRLWCDPPMRDPDCTLEFLRRSKNAPLNAYIAPRSMAAHYWRDRSSDSYSDSSDSYFDLSSDLSSDSPSDSSSDSSSDPSPNSSFASFSSEVDRVERHKRRGETRETEAMHLLLGHMSRFTSFHFRMYKKCLDRFTPYLGKPAPLLESVEISQASAVMDKVLLFDNQTPRLRHVRLSKFDFVRHGDSSLLKNLRSLELLDPINRPTKTQMLDLLRGMPLVETLKLTDAAPLYLRHNDNVPIPTQDTVPLDYLQRLELEDDLGNCAQLMVLLSLKHTPILVLNCPSYIPAAPHEINLFSLAIHSLLTVQNAIPLLSASFSLRLNRLGVKAWATVGDNGYVPTTRPHVSLDLYCKSIFPDWCRHLPLDQICALDLSSETELTTSSVNAFGLYNDVRAVRVEGGIATGFLAMLVAHKFPNPHPELQPMCPALEKLKLDRVDFSRKLDGKHYAHQLLQRAVADRCARGSRIEELHITVSKGLNARVGDRYKNNVGNLIWSGPAGRRNNMIGP